MAQQAAMNTFTQGMIMDIDDLNVANSNTVKALNATLASFNGHEGVLLNDSGNALINKNAKLPDGYIPVGSIEYGGILYIASVNKSTSKCLIGCFPSPGYTTLLGNLEWNYKPLKVGVLYEELGKNISTLLDLDTVNFQFSVNNPVQFVAEPSFDGSINLIFTDGINPPRLINTGFHAREDNTYLLINRYGENNTNRYVIEDKNHKANTIQDIFNILTTLYLTNSTISKFEFNGVESGGECLVGTYTFYAIACDKDGNESDILCESGKVPVFFGTNSNPFSVQGGIVNLKTDKIIKLTVKNIDSAYLYIKICYSRTTSDNNQFASSSYYKIDTLYKVEKESAIYNSYKCDISITGLEKLISITESDLNTLYFNASNAKTVALNQNMAFLGNIEQFVGESDYDTLRKLSLLIFPKVKLHKKITLSEELDQDKARLDEHAVLLDYNYENGESSYYNAEFCYSNTGYHDEEIYRFGIVYIREDNSLTSVFNIAGIDRQGTFIRDTYSNTTLNKSPNFNSYKDLRDSTDAILVECTDNLINANYGNTFKVNNRGVVKLDKVIENLTDVIGIEMCITPMSSSLYTTVFDLLGIKKDGKSVDNLTDALKSLGIKGYFYVRQKRIPTIIALAYVTNVCEDSFLPSINIDVTPNDCKTKVKGYLYESFAKTAFKKIESETNSNFYPKSIGDSVGQYNLTSPYKSRLFTLTDNCYAYFDRIQSNFIYNWWRDNIGSFGSELWPGGAQGLATNIQDDLGNSMGLMLIGSHEYGGRNYYDCRLNFAVKLTDSTAVTDLEKTGLTIELGLSIFRDLYTVINEAYERLQKLGFDYPANIKEKVLALISLESILKNEDGSTRTPVLSDLDNFLTTYSTVNTPSATTGWAYALQRLERSEGLALREIKVYNKEHYIRKRYSTARGSNKYGEIAVDDGWMPMLFYWNGNYYITIYSAMVDDWTAASDTRKYMNSCTNHLNEDMLYIYRNITSNDTSGYEADAPTFNGKYPNASDNLIKYSPIEHNAFAGFCPEYELNSAYYNNIFTGLNLKIRKVTEPTLLDTSQINTRRFIYNNIDTLSTLATEDEKKSNNYDSAIVDANILSVKENVSLTSLDSVAKITEKYRTVRDRQLFFSSKAGEASDCSFKFAGAKSLNNCYNNPNTKAKYKNESGTDVDNSESNTSGIATPFNLLRGIYGSYLGIVPNNNSKAWDIADSIINIYIPNYEDTDEKLDTYINIRIKDESPYYAISDKIKVNEIGNTECFRGDCFINWYTHRINRNFNDATLPYNDTIIDITNFATNFSRCFDKDYRTFNLEGVPDKDGKDGKVETPNFNLGDINAVKLGSWVTFPIRSSINTALRNEDKSDVSITTQCGHGPTFYPLHSLDVSGSNKLPESDSYNEAYTKSVNDKVYVNLNQTVYDKVYYKNRIIYSSVLLSDSISNGNRVFLSTHFKDYTDLYGSITKIISLASNLLCICEHGILLIPVNERALAAEGSGGSVYINTSNVLPDNPNVLSDTYGSTWIESIILTPYGVFGIDVSSNKIWKCDGSTVLIISDFKVLEFLNNYLQINKLEIGKSNVKTHYNKYKNDVMFTLYDSENDNYWNLCWNINQENWITFYSWIPLISENIGNCFISTNALNTKDTRLWKHGFSNRVPGDTILPTNWYGEQHPFEFEFIVRDKLTYHKIFDNLQIISNNVPPESFHYEIVGDCFEFSNDKPNMYRRQELTKAVMARLGGSSISYDDSYINIKKNNKSTIFPLYYNRENIVGKIEDTYKQLSNNSEYDYDALSGTEVIYYPTLDEFHFCTHAKGIDVKGNGGHLRGNMTYLEDIWKVQINPINLVQSNESEWINNKIPIVVNGIKVTDNSQTVIQESALPNGYTAKDFAVWDISKRKEVKLKDKYIKIRIRYKGDKYALISAINTLYTISFA